MLILSRKTNESIVIDGRITVKIVRVEGDVVKLGVEAPADVPVHRQEVYEEIQRNNQAALTQGRPVVAHACPKPETQEDLKRTAGRWNAGPERHRVKNAKPQEARKVITWSSTQTSRRRPSAKNLQTSQAMLSKSLARLSSGPENRQPVG